MAAKRSTRTRGKEGFETWYAEHWQTRWPALLEALLRPPRHVAWWNHRCDLSPAEVLPEDAVPSEHIPGCWEAKSFAPPPADSRGILAYYLLDGASVLAAQSLQVQPDDRVLDICAAPGGKSLILASALDQCGSLLANERSKTRLGRLRQVLTDYLPKEVAAQRVTTSSHDATRWCLYEKDRYDRILLDVPCSSERHLLADARALQQWTPARSRHLAVRQYAILASALEIVKPGGTIVYSTCSISPLEGDQVLAKLSKKRPGRVETLPPTGPLFEPTEYGAWLLPDACGWGPMYVAILRRIK